MAGMYGGGSNDSSMMMSMGMSCVCAVSVLALGGAAFYAMNNSEKDKEAELLAEQQRLAAAAAAADEEDDAPASSMGFSSMGATDIGGRRVIKTGGNSLVVDPKKCSNKQVYFANTKENDSHRWNFIPVPNKEGYFYVQSESRLFKRACPGYLTATSSCDGGVQIDKPIYADRQYWQAVQTGSGHQLQNVACLNKRKASYLTASGSKSGKTNHGRLYNRAGTIFTLESSGEE